MPEHVRISQTIATFSPARRFCPSLGSLGFTATTATGRIPPLVRPCFRCRRPCSGPQRIRPKMARRGGNRRSHRGKTFRLENSRGTLMSSTKSELLLRRTGQRFWQDESDDPGYARAESTSESSTLSKRIRSLPALSLLPRLGRGPAPAGRRNRLPHLLRISA